MATLKELRKRKGLTQKNVADALGVKPSLISRYESGGVIPPANKRKALACGKEIEKSDEEPDMDYIVLIGEKAPPEKNADNTLSIEKSEMIDLYRRLLIATTDGCCEMCGNKAPFCDKEGRPYLEIHEIDTSPSGKEWINRHVALCPTCLKKLEILKDGKEIEKLRDIALMHTFKF